MTRLAALPLLLATLLALPARGDIVLTPLEGEPVRGISLTLDGRHATIHTSEGETEKVPVAEVVSLATVPAPAPPSPATRPFELELACGSRLRGGLREAPEDFIELQTPALELVGGSLRLRIEDVRAVRRVAGAKMPGEARLVRLKDFDTAYTTKGARVRGIVARFGASDVLVRRDLGDRRVPYDELAAVFLDVERQPRPDGVHLSARLRDGSRLFLRDFAVTGGVLQGDTPTGYHVRVALARVAGLGVRGGSFVHVSDLEPKSVERTPFFPIPEGPAAGAMLEFLCPVRVDRSPDDRPIRLRGREYEKGLGVRPTTRLTYSLDGAYRRFDAVCGIDDEVLGPGYGRGAGTGSVVFAVLVDGKEVFRSPVVKGGHEPVRVHVPVEGAAELTLVVDLVPASLLPGGKKDSAELDNAVWARPLLVK